MEFLPKDEDYFQTLVSKAPPENSNLLEYLKEKQLILAAGISGASLTITAAIQPFDESKEQLKDAAWVGAGFVAGEAFWIGGATMMTAAAASGIKRLKKTDNEANKEVKIAELFPDLSKSYYYSLLNQSESRERISWRSSLTIGQRITNNKFTELKRQMPLMAEHANNSKLFKTGFWINTSAAVGQFGVVSAGVVLEAPPSAWGLLSLSAADLVATLALRKAIYDKVQDYADYSSTTKSEAQLIS